MVGHKPAYILTIIVYRDFWLDLVILEVEKVAKLLTYPHYKNNRSPHTFPWQELKRLRQHNNPR